MTIIAFARRFATRVASDRIARTALSVVAGGLDRCQYSDGRPSRRLSYRPLSGFLSHGLATETGQPYYHARAQDEFALRRINGFAALDAANSRRKRALPVTVEELPQKAETQREVVAKGRTTERCVRRANLRRVQRKGRLGRQFSQMRMAPRRDRLLDRANSWARSPCAVGRVRHAGVSRRNGIGVFAIRALNRRTVTRSNRRMIE